MSCATDDGMAVGAMDETTIGRCARCGYRQRGLPVVHVCPECGMRYNEHSTVHRSTRLRWGAIALIGPVLWYQFYGLALLESSYRGALSGPSGFNAVAALIGMLHMTACAVWWILVYRVFKYGHVAAVTADGLFLRLMAFRSKLIPWSEIVRALRQRVPEGKPQSVLLVRTQRGADVIIGKSSKLFPTQADAEQFCAGANAESAAARQAHQGEMNVQADIAGGAG
jgi:hypothetical protein